MPMRLPRTSSPSTTFCRMMSTPSSNAVPAVMRPGGIGMSPMMLCTLTDLPQPDSPTIASVFPGATLKLAPRTALTMPP